MRQENVMCEEGLNQRPTQGGTGQDCHLTDSGCKPTDVLNFAP